MALKVGIVGFRGMVGSVLVERMVKERDFDHVDATFFSTSQPGSPPPRLVTDAGWDLPPVADATSVDALRRLDVIVSCQGGDYTTSMHPALRRAGFTGYFIDAASTLRMADSSVIILDPVNRHVIDKALDAGGRDFIGGNCTVSLMLMATHGLFAEGLVEWISSMTYQAASGAGAKNMRELVRQMKSLADAAGPSLEDLDGNILDLDRTVSAALRGPALPTAEFGFPLAGSLLPWIDREVDNGQSREEWKGHVEGNKILGLRGPEEIPVDGLCVRVGAMRSHSQALTIKLKRDVPLDVVEHALDRANAWVRLVPNEKQATLASLTPAAVSGTLEVPIGRVHKLKMGPTFVGAFTVGDQLLWGAAEPLRRMVRILVERG